MSIANGNPSTAASDASANPGAANLRLVDGENLSRDLVPGRGWAPSGTRPDSAVAVYWDFENVHASLMDDLGGPGFLQGRLVPRPQEPLVDIDPVAEYAATFGRIMVHRAYCNWQYLRSLPRWELQAHAVDLVQLFPLTGFQERRGYPAGPGRGRGSATAPLSFARRHRRFRQ